MVGLSEALMEESAGVNVCGASAADDFWPFGLSRDENAFVRSGAPPPLALTMMEGDCLFGGFILARSQSGGVVRRRRCHATHVKALSVTAKATRSGGIIAVPVGGVGESVCAFWRMIVRA